MNGKFRTNVVNITYLIKCSHYTGPRSKKRAASDEAAPFSNKKIDILISLSLMISKLGLLYITAAR